MVVAYGMSDIIGPVTLAEPSETVFLGRELGEHKNFSDAVGAQIDAEIHRIMTEQLARATHLLTEHRVYLNTIADRLVANETLEQEEFTDIVRTIIPASKLQQAADKVAKNARADAEVTAEAVKLSDEEQVENKA